MENGVNRVIGFVNKAASNNTVVNCFLGFTFVALSVRSLNQQKCIETLETQNESLLKSNKAIKKTIWDWKQQLYSQSQNPDSVFPVDNIKTIFGDAPTPPPGMYIIHTFAVCMYV